MLWKLTYLDSLTKFTYGGLFFKFGQILRGTPCNYNVKLPEHANSGEGAGAPITEELLGTFLCEKCLGRRDSSMFNAFDFEDDAQWRALLTNHEMYMSLEQCISPWARVCPR